MLISSLFASSFSSLCKVTGILTVITFNRPPPFIYNLNDTLYAIVYTIIYTVTKKKGELLSDDLKNKHLISRCNILIVCVITIHHGGIMPIPNDFSEISSIQASVFLSDFVFSASKILVTVIETSSALLDGDPTALPVPDDAPPEIPRLMLSKKDNSMRLQLSRQRIDLFRTKTEDEDQVSLGEFLDTAKKLLPDIAEKIGSEVVRIAVILERFCPDEKPPSAIADHFCKSEFMSESFDGPAAFELHSMKKYKFLKKFEVNSWVRVKSGRFQYGAAKHRPVIVVGQDINTWAELMDTTIYTNKDVSLFFSKISTEFDKILGLYFPTT